MGLSMIQLKNAALESSVGKKSVHALRCLNVTLPETGLVVLTGMSGSGKTALLHLLALRETPKAISISERLSRIIPIPQAIINKQTI